MYTNHNPNNDILQCMIRHNIAVLCGFTIASGDKFSGIDDYFLPNLKVMVKNFTELFEKFDKVENELFHLAIGEETDYIVNQLLVKLQYDMRLSIEKIMTVKSYSAYVTAVYVLSIFCICPTLLDRSEAYDFLQIFRRNYII